MKFAHAPFRVHLFTGIFTMLAASVLLGLNLQPHEQSSFVFTLKNNIAPDKIRLAVEGRQRVAYGWPGVVLASSDQTKSIDLDVSSSLPDLKSVPICITQCESPELISREKMALVAPTLLREINKMDPFVSGAVVFDFAAIAKYIAASVAILFIFGALIERVVRSGRRVVSAGQLQPEH